VTSFIRVLEYRIKTRLDRGRAISLGAALTAAGFVTSCNETATPLYGTPCNPPSCTFPNSGGMAGAAGAAQGIGGLRGLGGAPLTDGGRATVGGDEADGGDNGQENGGQGGIGGDALSDDSAGNGGAAGKPGP
jgi:hypothetical protein